MLNSGTDKIEKIIFHQNYLSTCKKEFVDALVFGVCRGIRIQTVKAL